MADIVDGHVVVLAPEERYRVELLLKTEHVERSGLALPLGHHPMLDANLPARVRIGPARAVARREDAGRAGFEIIVHRDAAIDREPSALGQSKTRPHADAHDNEIGLDRGARLQLRLLAFDSRDRILEMEDHALFFVQS